VGDLVWNRRTDARFFRIADGRSVDRKQESAVRLEPNGEEDWIVVRNSHPAIIDRGTFEQAEQVRKRRAGGRTGQVHRNGWGEKLGYLLTGLVTCAECGHHYQGRTASGGVRRKDGSLTKTLYYACGGYITKGRAVCEKRLFPKNYLEGLVLAEVKKRVDDLHSAGRRGLAQRLREALGSCQGEVKKEMRKLRSQLERIERITPNLLDNITSTNRELVDRRLKQLQREKALLEVRLGELATAEVKEAEVQGLTKELWDFLGRFDDTMASGPLEAKRAALRRFVKALSLQQQATRLEMELYGLPLPPALASWAAVERVTVACSAVTSGPQGGNG
jgi:hypothetical protein